MHYIVRTIGMNRGAPRLYLDTTLLLATAFRPGQRFDQQVDATSMTLTLVARHSGSRTVSAKMKPGRITPVIDINSKEALHVFAGVSAVRICMDGDRITATPIASDIQKMQRLRRLLANVTNGRCTSASLAHGIGIMSWAAHEGFSRAGLNLDLVAALELECRWLDQGHAVNPAWQPTTRALAVPLQEAAQDPALLNAIGHVDLIECGIPCSAASVAGRAKKGHARPEQHEQVGHLVVPTLAIAMQAQPAVFVCENVVPYASTASADLMRLMFRDMNYHTHEIELKGTDFGELEGRVRWFFVAVTHGIELDLKAALHEEMERPRPIRYVAEILDAAVPSSEWRTFSYIDKKAQRDRAEGKGFKPQIVELDDIEIPTLRKGYAKVGSTDPLLQHPADSALKRRFTVTEHARAKGVPERVVEGMGLEGHQALGQSVTAAPVAWLFDVIGRAVRKWAADQPGNGSPTNAASNPAYRLRAATG